MKCPYCDQEMRPGVLNGDGRSAVRWKEGSKKPLSGISWRALVR